MTDLKPPRGRLLAAAGAIAPRRRLCSATSYSVINEPALPEPARLPPAHIQSLIGRRVRVFLDRPKNVWNLLSRRPLRAGTGASLSGKGRGQDAAKKSKFEQDLERTARFPLLMIRVAAGQLTSEC